jgi:hypothetical protein
MCSSDAFDDCQAEADTCVADTCVADTCVVGMYAFGAAKEWLDQPGHQRLGEPLAGVFHTENHAFWVDAGRDPHSAVFREVVDDGVVHEVGAQLQQERL